MKKITIKVNAETGEISVESSGYIGRSCESETKKLLEQVGDTTFTDKKPEYYQTTTQGITQSL